MAPHSPHQREKSQRARVESSVRAELDLENRNYVIIYKGRNVTITTDKAKTKRFKITKKVIEELISDYVLVAELMLKD